MRHVTITRTTLHRGKPRTVRKRANRFSGGRYSHFVAPCGTSLDMFYVVPETLVKGQRRHGFANKRCKRCFKPLNRTKKPRMARPWLPPAPPLPGPESPEVPSNSTPQFDTTG
jgi:hypothetical protein